MDLNNGSEELNIRTVKHFMEQAVKAAEEAGYVVTVVQIPQQPLGMGNYITTVDVRPCRKHA